LTDTLEKPPTPQQHKVIKMNITPPNGSSPILTRNLRRLRRIIRALRRKISDLSKKYPIAFALGEISVGLALVTAAISMGLATVFDTGVSLGAKIGAAVGGPIGGAAGYVIGGIGVAAMGGAVGIPAVLLTLASAAISALAGYAGGDLVSRVLDPVTFVDWIGPGFLLAAGAWLVLSGLRRLHRNYRGGFVSTPCRVPQAG
jgi:hypothetical protein